jgi:hypothetical protein
MQTAVALYQECGICAWYTHKNLLLITSFLGWMIPLASTQAAVEVLIATATATSLQLWHGKISNFVKKSKLFATIFGY